MRVINRSEISKFRLYDEKYRCWSKEPLLAYPGTPMVKQGHVIQWWTGLVDINDKEIYEGDILENPYDVSNNIIGQVLYESDHGGYIFQWKRKRRGQGYKITNLNCDVAFESVIVGNIFEHSELLN